MSQIFFTIITTTYKRPGLLQQAVESVLAQKYLDWSLIIVNDSPTYDYSIFENNTQYKDARITYIRNDENIGKNKSVNKVLNAYIQNTDNGYCIFLDDDDWLSPTALIDLQQELSERPKWLVTQRVQSDGTPFTVAKAIQHSYMYFTDYLLRRKLLGDATHILRNDIALQARFSNTVKNGEEWFYYIQLPRQFSYAELGTTISSGYSPAGLNQHMQVTYKKNTYILFGEIKNLRMFVYLLMRTIKSLAKI